MPQINGSSPLTQSFDFVPVDFAQPFFQPDVPMGAPPDIVSHGEQAVTARVYYCAATYGDHAAFCQSPDFARYRHELYEDVESLRHFYEQQCQPDAAKVAVQLRRLYDHRFSESLVGRQFDPAPPYFGDKVYLIDGQGKQSLDRICDMVRDARIPIDKKTATIGSLAAGLGVCAAGVVSNLISAEGELAMSTAGIRAELWKVKDRVAEAVIRQAVYSRCSHRRNYVGHEIHLVNSTWNYVADTLGLIPRVEPDAIQYLEQYVEADFAEACRDKVRRAMMPDRFAGLIAEECLSMFTSRLAGRKRALSGDCSARSNEDFLEVLQNIQTHYQLAPADLQLQAFVWIDDSGTHYRVRCDATLIARALLKIMRTEGLLTEESVAVNHGQWVDGDGMQHAFLTFGGSLAWRADRIDMPSGTSDWSLDTEAEQFTMRDLYAWWEACGSRATMFPTVFPAVALTAVLRQAVDGANPADIDDIPSSWFIDIENLFIVLPHMNDKTAQRCLQVNLPYFRKYLSPQACADLIDRAMGKSTAMLEFAQFQFPNPWEMLSEPRGGKAGSRLQYWMATDNGIAIGALCQTIGGKRFVDTGTAADGRAIFEALRGLASKPALTVGIAAGNANATAAWFRLAVAPGVIEVLEERLSSLLEAKDANGCTGLGRALADGRAEMIEQFHDLFAQPAVAAQIGKALRTLLAAPVSAGVPGLLVAMEDGYAEAVQVFHAMLVAPTVLPRIASELPALVRARGRRNVSPGRKAGIGTTGLVQAMKYGRASAIRAFHVMVADPRILARIVKMMPSLVTDKGRDGKGCLAAALEHGRAGAIRMFHDMLADPSITPTIKGVLNEVVLARTPDGQTGLGLALEKGHASAIEEFHALLVDPAIRPFIARSIPKLLARRRRGNMSDVSLALRNNHAPAVDAYAAMLADPAILPLIRHDLSRVMHRVLVDLEKLMDVSDTSKLLQAMRKNQSAALASFCLMVKRPEIASSLDKQTLKSLRVLEADDTEAIAESARTATDTVPDRGAALSPTPRTNVRRLMDRVVQRLAGKSQGAG